MGGSMDGRGGTTYRVRVRLPERQRESGVLASLIEEHGDALKMRVVLRDGRIVDAEFDPNGALPAHDIDALARVSLLRLTTIRQWAIAYGNVPDDDEYAARCDEARTCEVEVVEAEGEVDKARVECEDAARRVRAYAKLVGALRHRRTVDPGEATDAALARALERLGEAQEVHAAAEDGHARAREDADDAQEAKVEADDVRKKIEDARAAARDEAKRLAAGARQAMGVSQRSRKPLLQCAYEWAFPDLAEAAVHIDWDGLDVDFPGFDVADERWWGTVESAGLADPGDAEESDDLLPVDSLVDAADRPGFFDVVNGLERRAAGTVVHFLRLVSRRT